MDSSSWILPVIIVAALATTAAYFVGRRDNVTLMKLYASVLETALRPVDQQYTWIGGYLGFRAEYQLKGDVVKTIKATLHLKPRMSIMYLPVSRFTMPRDRLYIVIESRHHLPGEAHLIQKGQYRLVPAGIENIEQFRKRQVVLGGTEFELLYLDSRGEKGLLGWAEAIRPDDYSMLKHLSFTSSTNVVYARIEPGETLIPSVLHTGLEFTRSLAK